MKKQEAFHNKIIEILTSNLDKREGMFNRMRSRNLKHLKDLQEAKALIRELRLNLTGNGTLDADTEMIGKIDKYLNECTCGGDNKVSNLKFLQCVVCNGNE